MIQAISNEQARRVAAISGNVSPEYVQSHFVVQTDMAAIDRQADRMLERYYEWLDSREE